MPITIKEAQLKYKDPNTGDYVPVAAIADYSDIDVRVNGTSVMNDGIANIPSATISQPGVLKASGSGSGLQLDSNGYLKLNHASSSQMKTGTSYYAPITAGDQHESVFYGLAKAAGDSTQSQSSNPVGTYTSDAQSAIKEMLGVNVEDVQLNGMSIVNNGVANIPVADVDTLGTVKVRKADGYYGVRMTGSDILTTAPATDNQVKGGTESWKPLNPMRQHLAVFFGLSKVAGVDLANADVTLGEYPDSAKVAIQKMLGIYEAPWELIREDTFTNATEAEYTISVDGDGNAFQLTDVVLVFTVPTQENTAVVGGYGRVYYYNGNTNIRTQYLYSNASLTINANSGSYAAISVIEQNKGLMKSYWMEYRSQASHGYWQSVNGSDADGVQTSMGLKDTHIDSIKIAPFTGTMNYRLLGKRKWD